MIYAFVPSYHPKFSQQYSSPGGRVIARGVMVRLIMPTEGRGQCERKHENITSSKPSVAVSRERAVSSRSLRLSLVLLRFCDFHCSKSQLRGYVGDALKSWVAACWSKRNTCLKSAKDFTLISRFYLITNN